MPQPQHGGLAALAQLMQLGGNPMHDMQAQQQNQLATALHLMGLQQSGQYQQGLLENRAAELAHQNRQLDQNQQQFEYGKEQAATLAQQALKEREREHAATQYQHLVMMGQGHSNEAKYWLSQASPDAATKIADMDMHDKVVGGNQQLHTVYSNALTKGDYSKLPGALAALKNTMPEEVYNNLAWDQNNATLPSNASPTNVVANIDKGLGENPDLAAQWAQQQKQAQEEAAARAAAQEQQNKQQRAFQLRQLLSNDPASVAGANAF